MTPIETRVESVTLYHRGATVRRTAQLDFSGGIPAELSVAGLPLALLDHSLRVHVETDGGELALSNVRVGLSAPPRGTPPKAPEQKALDEVRLKLERARDAAEQLEQELARISAVPVLPRALPEEGKQPAASPMAARALLQELADESLGKRVELLRAARAEVKKLVEEEQALLRQIHLASTANQVRPDELRKSVHAVLAGGGSAKKGRLVLDYFVAGARWAPAYQCRMTRDCRQADLQLRAMVCQRTGEDWNGVKLSLSTASPMSWTELPELSAIRIGKTQPPPPGKRGFRPPPQGAASLFSDFDRGSLKARASLPSTSSYQASALALAPLPEPVPVVERERSRRRQGYDSDDKVGAPPAEESYESEEAEPMAELAAAPPAMRSMAVPAMLSMPAPAPPPMAGAAPMRQEKMRSAPPKKMAARDAQVAESADDGGGIAPPSLEVVLYASLRLPPASDTSSRGKLVPVDRRQLFIESLSVLGLVATFDVLQVVESAEAQGLTVANAAPPSGTSDVRSEAGWYDYVYATDAAVDVPSDGTFHSVPVNTRTATGDVLYVCVPREDPQVYRQAQVRNPLPSPLLPGPVEVYVAGEYVLTTGLPSVAPGGDFKLSLGVEQAIKVARNTKFQEQRSGDKVVATNELLHDIEIEVVNNLDREAKCEVRERIPQPAPEAEVVVEEGKVAPPWEPYKQEERGTVIDGGRRWVLSVGGGAAQKLIAQYRVKLYANNELVGGNRREA